MKQAQAASPLRLSTVERGEQEAGVVIEHVHYPDRLALRERDLSRVDLPEIVRDLALETLVCLEPARRLRREACQTFVRSQVVELGDQRGDLSRARREGDWLALGAPGRARFTPRDHRDLQGEPSADAQRAWWSSQAPSRSWGGRCSCHRRYGWPYLAGRLTSLLSHIVGSHADLRWSTARSRASWICTSTN